CPLFILTSFVPLFVTKVLFLGCPRTSIPLFIENSANVNQIEPNNGLNVRQHQKKGVILPNNALNVRSTNVSPKTSSQFLSISNLND
ncbi:hypothetical protein, partial [Gracilibacillus suaedae]|uniref:hypothetical protein n=1 Tax=Gracilibacillus suaedae TaxID=2820273 RepID=UPI001ABE0151